MKKIFKFIILFFICLFSIVGNAETTINFEWKLEDKYFISDKQGEYYFLDENSSENYYVYDKNGANVKSDTSTFFDSTIEEIYNNEVFRRFFNYNEVDLKYNQKDDVFFYVDYYDEEIVVTGVSLDDEFTRLSFVDNVEKVKEYLGVEYTIYEAHVAANFDDYCAFYDDGYYIFYYGDSNNAVYLGIYDNEGNKVLEKEINDNYYVIARVDNNQIYVLEEHTKINVYNSDGELENSFNINDYLSSLYNNHDFQLYDFIVSNNNVMLFYDHYLIEPKGIVSVKDFYSNVTLDRTRVQRDYNYLFLKYRIESDMTLVTAKTGGSFTAERKIDEQDREYVELKITLADGYIVDTIKVTDANGNEIEVTDNKFYMPGSDVTVQVTYKGGEYLSIPDTGFGKSITLIIIGLILVSLGAYTINYVRQE